MSTGQQRQGAKATHHPSVTAEIQLGGDSPGGPRSTCRASRGGEGCAEIRAACREHCTSMRPQGATEAAATAPLACRRSGRGSRRVPEAARRRGAGRSACSVERSEGVRCGREEGRLGGEGGEQAAAVKQRQAASLAQALPRGAAVAGGKVEADGGACRRSGSGDQAGMSAVRRGPSPAAGGSSRRRCPAQARGAASGAAHRRGRRAGRCRRRRCCW